MSIPPEAVKPAEVLAGVAHTSERARADHEYKASEDRFRRLIEGAPDGVVISRAGVILYANAAAATQLGFAGAADLVGQSMTHFLEPAELAVMVARINIIATTNAPIGPREYKAKRKDGTLITTEITSLPIEYDGAPAVLAIARDVTGRANLQAQLAHADRLTALGSLAAGVAHEINNPLAFASLGLDAVEKFITRAIPDEAQRREALALIADVRFGADRVAGIVRDLKAFSRPSDDQIGPVDITAVLKSVERMVAREIRPRAVFSLELPPLPPILGNVARLEQVFVNLLLNAAQAMSEGGATNLVAVRGQHTPDGTVEIEVRDNGPGMTKETLERIFEPFFTTKPVGVGMGLGLSVCHGIVTQLGGTITIESELGRGTVARVTLPVSASPLRRSTVAPVTPRSPLRGKILIVDDEVSVGITLKYLLDERHDVTTLTNGEAALQMLLGGASFDLVLCDLMMPGLSGMEVHARLASEASGLERKLVFMTGGAFTPRAISFLATVPNARVDKPFALAAIEELVDERLRDAVQAHES